MALPSERALLSLFFSRMQQEDPDIICSHNLLGICYDNHWMYPLFIY